MESYHICNARTNLAPRHRAMLEQGSAIAPDVIAESGARSIRGGSELPNVFSERQRRLGPGVLYVVHRPSEAGGTSYCFRPDRPDPENPGNKYQQPSKARGGVGNVLDVLPSQRHLINDTSVPVIFVEGTKKMLSVVSAAREAGATVLVVGIVGVWNWLYRPDGKHSEPIPDMLDIPLQGRKATIMFDSDVLKKWQVQMAARRLAEHAQGRGADVFVTYFHDMPDGSKCGADDYLAREPRGTFSELRMLTRRYDPADFVGVRLERDERLRAAYEDLQRRFWAARWKGQAEHSARDVCRVLIEAAVEYGRVLEGEAGVEVMISWGALALAAGNISSRTLAKALTYLEDEGVILRRVERENPRKSGGFVLAADTRAKVKHNREDGNPNSESNADVTSMYARTLLSRTPPMMWSSPGSKGRRGLVKGTRRVRQYKTEPRPSRSRPGKRRGHVADALEHAGGSMPLAEIAAELGTKPGRERELTRHKNPETGKGRDGLLIWYIDAGIIALEDGVVSLTADYLERIHKVREAGGEIEAEQHAADYLAWKRAGYREHLAEVERKRKGGPKSEPSPAAVANIAHSREQRRKHREHEERDRAAREARKREAAHDAERRERVEKWVREGMKRRFAEDEVYGRPPAEPETPPSEAPRKMPPKAGGVYVHGPECECWLCDESEAVSEANEPSEAGAA